MQSQEKYTFLRTVLMTIGLSSNAIDDIIDRIADFLSEKDPKAPVQKVFPYFLRDNFVTKAEHSFYLVLKSFTPETIVICPKVSLGDLFYVKSSDGSEYRKLTNKIDRKHVDFLLCDSKTMHPIAGIELDDKSHQRADRQIRDELVQKVFNAAKLPLVRFPAQYTYSVSELSGVLKPYFGMKEPPTVSAAPVVEKKNLAQICPKCGGEMILRTAKSGANQGEQFWGCSNYPKCHGILQYEKA
jgi:predicted RNA-binding Zn-ribbon protein involved in translation (DUF1610 family)